MARRLGKPRCQVIGYTGGSRQWAVPGGGRTYAWRWETLKRLLAPPQKTFLQWLWDG
jgi:hypothetical protein